MGAEHEVPICSIRLDGRYGAYLVIGAPEAQSTDRDDHRCGNSKALTAPGGLYRPGMDSDLTMTIRTNRGVGEVSVTDEDPLTGPFRRGMRTGQPTGRWRGVAITDDKSVPRVFGFLGLSEKTRRLMWFPAADLTLTEFNQDKTGDLRHFVGRILDHVTLDPEGRPGRYRSHLTHTDGSRGPTVTHQPRQGELIPWLSLLLPDQSMMRELPQKLEIRFASARSDQKYPRDVAGDGFWIVIDGLAKPAPHSFLQIDLWAGMTDGWEQLGSDAVPWPLVPGVARNVPDPLVQPARRAVFKLESDRGVALIMTRPSGELEGPRLMRANRVTH